MAELSKEKTDKINETLQSWVDTGQYAGIVNLTVKEGTIQHFEAFGYKDLASKSPMTTDAIFRIYSMTKPIVSVAMMQLVEKGRIGLESPIVEYFPEFKNLKVYEAGELVELREPITVRHLLTHSAGFSYGWSEHPVDEAYRKANMFRFDCMDSDDCVRRVSSLPLLYHPGEKWHYSIAVDLQGILIERISGLGLDQYLEEHFFQPLGMVDTGFSVPIEKKERFTTNYKNAEGLLEVAEDVWGSRYFEKRSFFSGGGGLVSTATDYLKFAEMLLNGGVYNGKRYLKEATLELMTRDHLSEILDDPDDPWSEHSFSLEDSSFGLGFRLNTICDESTGVVKTKQYSWNGAAGTEFWIDPIDSLINITLIQLLDNEWTLREDMEALVY
jgi:CubicO group peptidase (beta-lactamase class C family)